LKEWLGLGVTVQVIKMVMMIANLTKEVALSRAEIKKKKKLHIVEPKKIGIKAFWLLSLLPLPTPCVVGV